MRQVAWLNAVPESIARPGAKTPTATASGSRRERLVRDGLQPQLPIVAAGGHVLTWLFEVGPTQQSGMGPTPITFQELESWQRQTGLELQPWEVRMLRHLSLEYLQESQAAVKSDRKPPYGSLQRSPALGKKIDAFLD